jgi:hypothetical protein
MVDALNLCPQLVKKELLKHGINCFGKWPTKKNRHGNEYVDYNEFYIELENSCAPANNLVIVGKIDLSDFIDIPELDKITIPKGNNVGIFSSMNGGGSPFDMELKRDLTISLKNPWGKTKYDTWRICSDSVSYGINEAYGVTKQFWGSDLLLLQSENTNNKN